MTILVLLKAGHLLYTKCRLVDLVLIESLFGLFLSHHLRILMFQSQLRILLVDTIFDIFERLVNALFNFIVIFFELFHFFRRLSLAESSGHS